MDWPAGSNHHSGMVVDRVTRTDEALEAYASVWAATVKAQARNITNAKGWHATTEAAFDMIERNAGHARTVSRQDTGAQHYVSTQTA